MATHPAGEQAGGQGAEKKVGAENGSGDAARSAAAVLAKSREQEDESIDRSNHFASTSDCSKQRFNRVWGIDTNSNLFIFSSMAIVSSKRSLESERSLQKSLKDSRKEYISKNRELRHKQSELDNFRSSEIGNSKGGPLNVKPTGPRVRAGEGPPAISRFPFGPNPRTRLESRRSLRSDCRGSKGSSTAF